MKGTTSARMSESGLFWEKFAPIIFREELLEQALREVTQVIDLVGTQPKQRILDVGCGIGRHSLEFARRGFEVTGIDISPSFITRAGDAAGQQELNARFIQCDMREFLEKGSFDLAVNLFSSFGYFDEPADNQRVLNNICQSLSNDGTLVLQLKAKELLARTFVERDWEEADGLLLLTQRSIEQDWCRMALRMIFVEDGVQHQFQTRTWLYSASELASMLKQAGFQSVSTYGDYDKSPYDYVAKRTVMVARKSSQ